MHLRARLRTAALTRYRGEETHTQLAARTGIDRTTLINAEAGRRQLGVTALLTLAGALDVTVEDLVELIDDRARHRATLAARETGSDTRATLAGAP